MRVLILALGANDGAARPVDRRDEAEPDGRSSTARARRNIVVILAGMEAPPNYGPEYVQSFRTAFRESRGSERVLLIPFLLDKVAGAAR